jgi:hypothetical protein
VLCQCTLHILNVSNSILEVRPKQNTHASVLLVPSMYVLMMNGRGLGLAGVGAGPRSGELGTCGSLAPANSPTPHSFPPGSKAILPADPLPREPSVRHTTQLR